jgi:hypothetical protein
LSYLHGDLKIGLIWVALIRPKAESILRAPLKNLLLMEKVKAASTEFVQVVQ